MLINMKKKSVENKTKLDKVLLRIKHKEKKNFKNIWKKDERKEGYL